RRHGRLGTLGHQGHRGRRDFLVQRETFRPSRQEGARELDGLPHHTSGDPGLPEEEPGDDQAYAAGFTDRDRFRERESGRDDQHSLHGVDIPKPELREMMNRNTYSMVVDNSFVQGSETITSFLLELKKLDKSPKLRDYTD